MSGIRNIPIGDIRENPSAIRTVNKQAEDYLSLVDSIKEKGFRGSITVREMKDPNSNEIYYAVVAGMHRYSAAKDLGLEAIPCDIADFNDAQSIEFSIMENCNRKTTTASEYLKGITDLLNLNPLMTEAELATKLARSPAWINNVLNLNKIENDEIMALINNGSIALANAYALAKLPVEEMGEFITDAQTKPPSEFIPLVHKRVKEIRDAKRAGQDPSKLDFTPAEYMQKMKDIKEERTEAAVCDALIKETGITTAQDGFILALKWVLHSDPFSVAEQKAEWETKQAAKEEKKKQREVEKAAKMKVKKENELKLAIENEQKVVEVAKK